MKKFSRLLFTLFICVLCMGRVYAGGGSDDSVTYDHYECPSGYTLSGTKCIKTENANTRSGAHWCSNTSVQPVQSGNKWVCIYEIEATFVKGTASVDENSASTDNSSSSTDNSSSSTDNSSTTDNSSSSTDDSSSTTGDSNSSVDENAATPPASSTQNGGIPDGYVFVSAAKERQGVYYCEGQGLVLVGVSCYGPSRTITYENKSDDSGNAAGNCPLGPDVTKDLSGVLKIMKIAAPLLMIAYTIIDTLRTVANGKIEDESKKLYKTFTKRLVYTIILFFIPVLVDQFFQMADVWNANGTCDLNDPNKNQAAASTN